jgi:hypothetical protein
MFQQAAQRGNTLRDVVLANLRAFMATSVALILVVFVVAAGNPLHAPGDTYKPVSPASINPGRASGSVRYA